MMTLDAIFNSSAYYLTLAASRTKFHNGKDIGISEPILDQSQPLRPTQTILQVEMYVFFKCVWCSTLLTPIYIISDSEASLWVQD